MTVLTGRLCGPLVCPVAVTPDSISNCLVSGSAVERHHLWQ